MEIEVTNQHFKKLFLEQISKISDNAVLTVEDSALNCLCSSADNSIILSSRLTVKTDSNTPSQKINVGDLKKLIRAFDCVEKETVKFDIKNNNITYADNEIQFKYHLLEDGIINIPKINLQKLETLDFDAFFTITDKTFNDLIKGSTFSTDSNKLYLTSQGPCLKGNLTDKTRHNIDSFEVNISKDFTGAPLENLCINFETVRILSTLKVNSINCKVSSKLGVVLFNFENNILKTTYIVSSLTK